MGKLPRPEEKGDLDSSLLRVACRRVNDLERRIRDLCDHALGFPQALGEFAQKARLADRNAEWHRSDGNSGPSERLQPKVERRWTRGQSFSPRPLRLTEWILPHLGDRKLPKGD